jgi:hypothetical protein
LSSAPPTLPDNVTPAVGDIPGGSSRTDRAHAYVDRKFNRVVSWVDGLFGGEAPGDPGMTGNFLRWGNELRAEEGSGIRYHPSLRARVRLPKLGKRFRLVIVEENREEAVAPVPSDPGTPVVNTPTEANTLRAVNTELRYYTHDTRSGYLFLAAGSRFVWPPETFVRARALKRFLLGDNSFASPSVTPFWQDRIGFGVTPQLDFGVPIARNHLFLWTNSATVFDKRKGILWGTEVSLTRFLSSPAAVALAVGASGSTRQSAVEDNFRMISNRYNVAVRYRRNLFKPWFVLELSPEGIWRREGEGGRKFVAAFVARLEVSTEGPRALLPVPIVAREHVPVP